MKNILIILIGFVFVQTPIRYQAEDQSFSIWQPGEFIEQLHEIKTEIGLMRMFTIECKFNTDEDDNFMYMLNYTEYPEEIGISTETDLHEDLLTNTVLQLSENYEGKLIYTTPCSASCKQFRIGYDYDEYTIKGKIFIDGDRLYIIQVHSLTENSLNDRIDDFLGSYKKNEA